MIYFKKIWIPLVTFCIALYCMFKYLPILFNFIVVNTAAINLPISLKNTLAKWNIQFQSITAHLQVNVAYILTFIIVLLILWFIINAFTGQLNRDIKTIFVKRHLLSQVPADDIGSSAKQEKIANTWIKKLRVIKYKKKTYLIIPCGLAHTTLAIIKHRCGIFLLPMLNQTFKKIDWVQEVEVKTFHSMLFLIVKSK